MVIIDTGSSDLWVRGTSDAKGTWFNCTSSSTFVSLNESFDVSYDSGIQPKGHWAMDTFVFDEKTTVQNMTFRLGLR